MVRNSDPDQRSRLRRALRLGQGRWFAAAAACLAIAFACATLRFLWLRTDLAPEQYQIGYFEEAKGVASLVLDDAQHTSVVPDVGLAVTGALSLPPGRSIGLPLVEGAVYRIRVDDRSWAPFCVFGDREAMPGGDNARNAYRLARGRTLVVRDGGLSEMDWVVVRPWRDDQQSLQQLRDGCAARNNAPLIVRQRAGHTEIEYGRCSYQLHDAVDTLAVLAGPAWTSVERLPGWRVEQRVQIGPLLFTAAAEALQFAILSVAVGAAGAALLAAAAFGVASVRPEAGIIGFTVLLLFGSAAAGMRMIVAVDRSPSKLRLAVGSLLVVAPFLIALMLFVPLRFLPSEQFSGTPARCLLLGYSAMRGDSLRGDSPRGPWHEHGGAWDEVNSCQACAGSVERRAKGAGRFSWIRDMVCSTQRSIAPGGTVLFFGGSNDDFVWRRLATSWVAQAVRLARYAYTRPSAEEFRVIAASAVDSSVEALEMQDAALDEALTCVTRQRASFRYFHDFFVWDLAEPRSEARQRMFSARAARVRSAGGKFVDVLAEVEEEAGVWWFNDYIHPSEIAHRQIGELMCRELNSPP